VKQLFAVLFLTLSFSAGAQSLKVLSAKDSAAIPFAAVQIKGKSTRYHFMSEADGVAGLALALDDTATYQLTVYSAGFEKYQRALKGAAIAKAGSIFLKPSDIALDEVVVTAQYSATAAGQSVQKVKVIDSEKIRQMAAVNLRDVLTNQMNVRLQQDNILGSSLSLQGVGGQNIKILIDGVPVIGRQNGNLDLSQINLNNVERIELIEGPLSVQYGTNALAGTINIITRKSEKKFSAGVTTYYESIGTYNVTANLSAAHNKHSWQLSGGRNYFDGWNPGDPAFYLPKPHVADSSRFQQWKPKEQYFASGAYQYRFKKLEAGIQSGYFSESITNRGYPRAPYAEDAFDDHYYTSRFDNSAFLKGKLSSDWSVNALAAYNYYRRIKKTVYKDLTTLDETLSSEASDQDTSRFTQLMSRASFVHAKPNTLFSYELGYDVNYQSVTDKRIEKELQYMGDYALYATTEYHVVSNMVIKPGLRYAYNTMYKTPLIPSLNVKWDLGKHTLRASYARGFRAPDIKELYFLFVDVNHNIIGNSNLKAEQSNNCSASYHFNTRIKKSQFKADASVFYNDIYNLITLAQINSAQYSYVNIGRYKTLGLQLSGTIEIKQLTLQTGFNYTGRYNDLSEDNSLPKFSYSPEVQANLSYKLTKLKAGIAVFYKYNGRLPGFALSSDNKVVPTSIAAYQMMDMTLNKYFWKERLNLALGCKNMFNVKNIAVSGSTGGVHSSAASSTALATGRYYFIKLSFNFSKS